MSTWMGPLTPHPKAFPYGPNEAKEQKSELKTSLATESQGFQIGSGVRTRCFNGWDLVWGDLLQRHWNDGEQ